MNVPVAGSPGPELEGPSGPSPVAAAFKATAPAPAAAPANTPDWGALLKAGVYAGMDPKELGGYNLFGAANQFGATAPQTQNAQVGAGQPYESTFGALDRKQTDAVSMNDADNATSRQNNAATIAAANARHADTLAQMGAGGGLDDGAVTYAADIYRRTGQLPALGMGRAAAGLRTAVINRAAAMDAADNRTGADAVVSFAENQGARASARTLGTREANAGMAVNELSSFIPIAKESLAPIYRTGFLPVDQLYQAYQSNTNDPALAKAHAALQATENAYARAISPNGVPTDASRATAHEMLTTARSPDALYATLDQMQVEAQAALRAPEQTREQMRASLRNSAPAHGGEAKVPHAEATKVLNGVTYHKINGKWMQE
jgi:hypothetical protein